MECDKCGGVMIEEENTGNSILLKCVRCGDEVRVFRNQHAKEEYEKKLKIKKEEAKKRALELRKKPQYDLWNILKKTI